MDTFHFLRPHLLFLALAFAILFVFLIRRRNGSDNWQNICSKDLIPHIIAKKSQLTNWPYAFAFFTMMLLVIAVSGPAWKKISVPLIKQQTGLVIALDLSSSMNAEDVKPSRLKRAIYKIEDLLDRRKEGQTALIVFSDHAFVVTPLTDDVQTIKNLLTVLETSIMPSFGQRTSAAVNMGAELLVQASVPKGSILLVTAELSDKEMKQSIRLANQNKVTLSVLGIGTEGKAPIPAEKGGFLKNSQGALIMSALAKDNLMKLAQETNGVFTELSLDDRDIDTLNHAVSANHSSEVEETEFTETKWHDQGYLLVLLSLPFTLLLFRRGVLVLVLFLMPQGLQAIAYNDLWQTKDQLAEQFFINENYQEAKDLFQHQEWKAASCYRLGDYESAAELFEEGASVRELFNYGTAKAKLGEFEEALTAYEKLLGIEPEHEDALYNKQLIEEHLKEQTKPPSENKNQSDQQKKSEEKSENDGDQDSEESQSSESDQTDESEDSKESTKETDNQPPSSEDTNESSQLDDHEKEELKEQHKEKMDKEIEETDSEETQVESQQMDQDAEEAEEDSQDHIDDQWLKRINHDPSALLRRKFLHQYRNNKKLSDQR